MGTARAARRCEIDKRQAQRDAGLPDAAQISLKSDMSINPLDLKWLYHHMDEKRAKGAPSKGAKGMWKAIKNGDSNLRAAVYRAILEHMAQMTDQEKAQHRLEDDGRDVTKLLEDIYASYQRKRQEIKPA